MGKASRVGNDGGVVSTKGSRAEGGDKRPPIAPLRLCKPPDLESRVLPEVGAGESGRCLGLKTRGLVEICK